jgi:hypothetical protein
VSSPQSAAWSFELANGKPFSVRATIEGRWLALRTKVPGDRPGTRWAAALLNRRLPGASKLIELDPGRYLVTELPLPEGTDAAARVPAASDLLIAASAVLEALGDPERSTRDDGGDKENAAARADACERLVAELGWDLARRSDDRLVVSLDTGRGFHQATLEPAGSGFIASAELCAADPLPEPCREALGALLLRASHEVRGVRGAAEEGSRPSARFEARLGPSPTAAELDHALEGLATACAQFGPEARALTCEATARRYIGHLTPHQGE